MLAIEEFSIAFRPQRAWGVFVAMGLFLSGLGAGLFLISLYAGFKAGSILGILITLLGALHLLLDLKRPQQFWRAVSRPVSSWISRGVISIGLYVLFGLLYVFPQLGWASLPWGEGSALGQVFLVLASICAFVVLIYTGFVLSTPPGISLWHTGLLPLLFSLYAFSGGLSVLFIWQGLIEGSGATEGLQLVQAALVAASLACLVVYLAAMSSSTTAAKESLRLLLKNEPPWLFIGGVIFLGLIVPLVTAATAYVSGAMLASSGLVLVGTADLVGSFLFRYTLLKSGLYAPVW